MGLATASQLARATGTCEPATPMRRRHAWRSWLHALRAYRERVTLQFTPRSLSARVQLPAVTPPRLPSSASRAPGPTALHGCASRSEKTGPAPGSVLLGYESASHVGNSSLPGLAAPHMEPPSPSCQSWVRCSLENVSFGRYDDNRQMAYKTPHHEQASPIAVLFAHRPSCWRRCGRAGVFPLLRRGHCREQKPLKAATA